MDEMTAFERQVADEIFRVVGPARPVDDVAVFDAAAASRSPRWGFTVLSALRFVAAGVIVTLFGGFLLAGVFTEPRGDEMAPAAVTESPSPVTTEELLSGMAFEEVEPGILRVLDDGVRDLHLLPGAWGQHGGVTIGADGSVWLNTASGWYYRLGEEPRRYLPEEFREAGNSPPSGFGAHALHAGPAGQLWAWDARQGRVNALSDDEWLERSDVATEAMAVDGHNEVWAARLDGLLHVEDEGKTLVPWPIDQGRKVAPFTLAVSADGRSCVLSGPADPDAELGFLDTLLCYDGSRWLETALPTPISAWFQGHGMGVGADGTIWVAGDDYGRDDEDFAHRSLARLDGTEWTVFTADDGVGRWGGKMGFVPDERLSVAPDGSVWVDASTTVEGREIECDGVARFDGERWSRYLPGHCFVDIDFGPDGSAWVLAASDEALADIYPFVITPEAVDDANEAMVSLSAAEPTDADDEPTTTDGLLSGMVTEQIEPGVSRVINDGVRDIVVPVGGWGTAGLSIDRDGHVWVYGEKMAYRLGHPPETGPMSDGSVAGITSDGTLWATTPASTIASFDGETWTQRAILDRTASVIGIAVTPDGTAWATTVDSSQCPADTSAPWCRRILLVRMDEAGASTSPGWEGAEAGQLQWHAPVLSPDGDVWLVEASDAGAEDCRVGAFHRYDGSEWHTIDVPGGLTTGTAGETFGFGPDGTLWAATGSSGTDDGCMSPNQGLARLDEVGWTLFTQDEGVQTWGGDGAYGSSDALRVAPDGGVWVAGAGWDDCHGVARFDGEAWTPFLEGSCVDGLEIAPDGSVLALASASGSGPLGLYVITPEAVAVVD